MTSDQHDDVLATAEDDRILAAFDSPPETRAGLRAVYELGFADAEAMDARA